MANTYNAVKGFLVLDLSTKSGRTAAKTYAYVLLTSKEPEDPELARELLKEIERQEKEARLLLALMKEVS